MIRPFNLRDLPLVHRLSENGVALHTESALTKNLHPVRGALFSLVGGDFPTYVWKAKEHNQAGFIQLFLEEASHHGHILYLSSSATQSSEPVQSNGEGRETAVSPSSISPNESAGWLSLIDQAVIEAGRRGMHSLVAEVSETGHALPMLRQAGFVVYTRQDIWVLDNVDIKENGKILNPRQSKDDWEIQLLYANTVPRLVKIVEPTPPLYDSEGWVLRDQNEVAAFVHIHKGTAATWMRLYIHPNAESQIDDILYSALQVRPPSPTHPIYCCVRRYQSWVQNALVRHGFTLWGSQAVMVKHTVHHIPKALPDIRALMEAQGVTPTTPFVPRYAPTETNGVASNHNA
ncbi:MAG: hypothetical protein GY943_20990 [Chloroflexi bacterium]|nr:hypothetical protein [Chloroflexota bacterium]